ncbi:DUF1989 domain-containing protein [Archangium lipolyticum]|uniref:DUF1989 domain-containing protein n=1 Tax=Archangium lipolyticum TaxID=2970465 RepID=UPI00214A2A6C|nr:aminomethyltransferase family protein [Archangium lipolyticum]
MNAAVPRGLRVPGLRTLPVGVERYVVPGGGSIVVALSAGDRLRVLDPEGRQPGELVVFDARGQSRPELLGVTTSSRADGLLSLLEASGNEGEGVISALARRGVALRDARAIPVFGFDTPAGASVSYVAEASAICAVVSVGGPMAVDAHDAPTELVVFIDRAQPAARRLVEPPEPLAEPRLDLRVDRATALAYEAFEGEYIQIIDIEGRQCSDFLAFDRACLEAGLEIGIDPTSTRSLTGKVYPGPGLHSKFFGQDLQPLVEVVQDTCGRHDTFGLACFARFYEDKGYFGHANCSDNFNAVLAPYGLRTRPGWTAINLFYNTFLDAQNAIYLDDPWSRPGDYVLMRASRDLVCGSSACPDDIDPTNAWNPTDIQVRVYPARNLFKKAIAFRMTPDAEPRLTKETGFHPRTSLLTRNLVEYRGYWLPACYTGKGPTEEYYACREKAVVMDLSPLRKFEVLGPDAEALLQLTLTRDIRRVGVGHVVYSAMCYPTGGMIDDGTLFRLGADNFRWICGEEYGGVWLREQAERRGLRVWVKSSTDQLHNIAVQGPNSREILREVVWTGATQPTLDELGWFRFLIGRIGGPTGIPIIVSRTGYTGELGYEVWCHPTQAPAVWDAVWKAGEPRGLMPLGLDALNMLRIEAGLIFAGYEFNDQTDPFEAGIGFTVPLKSKEEDFIGREALMERKAHPQRQLVGLELEGNEPAGHGDRVYAGRAQIGTVTSGTRSPLLRKNIALARMDVKYVAMGTEVEIGKLDGHQKRIPATVVRFPFYDPDKSRVRA